MAPTSRPFFRLAPDGEEDIVAAKFPELGGLRYLLCVGTIDPRKNQALLLSAFDRLSAKDAGLVIVGRKGWRADDVLAALDRHHEFGKRVFWCTALDDQALLALYRHAYASVLPSHYEGYGLRVVEALSQGCVTVASDAGSLPEVAAGHAVFFRRGDGEALYAILERLYGDPDYYAGLKASAKSFRPTPPGARRAETWWRRLTTSPRGRRMISPRRCGRWCSCRYTPKGSISRCNRSAAISASSTASLC